MGSYTLASLHKPYRYTLASLCKAYRYTLAAPEDFDTQPNKLGNSHDLIIVTLLSECLTPKKSVGRDSDSYAPEEETAAKSKSDMELSS